MSDIELLREVRGLKGDKSLTELAVSSKQEEMKKVLLGEMGDDMKAVLNGDKKIEISTVEQKKFQLKSWFKRLLRRF